MTTPIDYSRPVGWWCPVALSFTDDMEAGPDCHCAIPVYLPIPEGQRPPAASEVEEAEVVTVNGVRGSWCVRSAPPSSNSQWLPVVAAHEDSGDINRIAQASARARIVTGATE